MGKEIDFIVNVLNILAELISISEGALGLLLAGLREASLLFVFLCHLPVCSPSPSFAGGELQQGEQLCFPNQLAAGTPLLSRMGRKHQPGCLEEGGSDF